MSEKAKPFMPDGILSRLLVFAKPYQRKLILSLAVGLLIACLSPVRPFLIQYMIDNYVRKQMVSMVFYVSALLIVLVLVEGYLNYFFSYTSSWIGQHVIKDIRYQVFQKIVQLNVRQFDKTPVGVFSTRTIDDPERVNDVFANGLLPVLVDIISVMAIVGYMFYTNAQLALVALSPFPLLVVAVLFFKNSVKKSFNAVRNAIAQLNAHINEQLTGIKTIKTFVAEGAFLSSFDELNKEHRTQNIKAIFAYSMFFPAVEIIAALSIGCLVWFGVGSVGSAGEVIAFILCITTIFRPLRIIADKFNTIQMGVLAAQRIFNVLDTKDSPAYGSFSIPNGIRGAVHFDQVCFSYDATTEVLKNVSFTLPAGQSLAIVGRTGSGKTTIISLLNRLYQHDSGRILIDGKPIEEYDLPFLRSQIGYVSQDVFLFSGSIYENIVFGNPSLPLSEVKKICKQLHLVDMIEQLPKAYEFSVVDGGTNLSSGQRQLISIARVFAQHPAIVVFDEATSSIDPPMESVIDFATESLFRDKTSIIIAHRYKTILKADNIMVLNKGIVTEFGKHKELVSHKKYYYDMFKRQFSTTI